MRAIDSSSARYCRRAGQTRDVIAPTATNRKPTEVTADAGRSTNRGSARAAPDRASICWRGVRGVRLRSRHFFSCFTIVIASVAVSLPTLPLEYTAYAMLPSVLSTNAAG